MLAFLITTLINLKKIFIASDHAGYKLKKSVLLKFSKNLKIIDLGPELKHSVDYPIYAKKLSKRYKLGRVRLLLKEPRSTLSWHRDPEPRLHIPIYTNPGAIMVIDKRAQHMPADGSVWVTNNLKYHNAFNGGEENRVHLVACVLDYKFN